MEIVNSIMLYGNEIWAEMPNVKNRANSLVSLQRTAALRTFDSRYNPYVSAGGRADEDF